MKAEVSVEELSVNTGLPKNQVYARAAELVKDNLATSRGEEFRLSDSL